MRFTLRDEKLSWSELQGVEDPELIRQTKQIRAADGNLRFIVSSSAKPLYPNELGLTSSIEEGLNSYGIC
jgi:hypothetical protein